MTHEQLERADDDVYFVASDMAGDILCPTGQPGTMPEFSLDEAYQIGAIAARLVESGEWDLVEERVKNLVGKRA